MNNILIEDNCNEEWWQPELHCKQCGCTFMWSSYGFSEYPNFCPNCGCRFAGVEKENTIIYNFSVDNSI